MRNQFRRGPVLGIPEMENKSRLLVRSFGKRNVEYEDVTYLLRPISRESRLRLCQARGSAAEEGDAHCLQSVPSPT
jgi:hypothetical protein